jgi:hypothetical protein
MYINSNLLYRDQYDGRRVVVAVEAGELGSKAIVKWTGKNSSPSHAVQSQPTRKFLLEICWRALQLP